MSGKYENTIGTMVVLLILSIAVSLLVIFVNRAHYRSKIIDHNCAEYNKTTGEFRWITIDTTNIRWEKVE